MRLRAEHGRPPPSGCGWQRRAPRSSAAPPPRRLRRSLRCKRNWAPPQLALLKVLTTARYHWRTRRDRPLRLRGRWCTLYPAPPCSTWTMRAGCAPASWWCWASRCSERGSQGRPAEIKVLDFSLAVCTLSCPSRLSRRSFTPNFLSALWLLRALLAARWDAVRQIEPPPPPHHATHHTDPLRQVAPSREVRRTTTMSSNLSANQKRAPHR